MTAIQSAPVARRMVTEFPGPRSRELHGRRAAAVADSIASTLPVYIRRAEGALLEDVDGNTFIDFGSGIGVLNVGNTAPAVVERVQLQVAEFTHTCFLLAPYEGYVEVCEHLNRLTPGTHEKRSILFNSGAEAVENAVKVARAATGRSAIVVFDHSFHGRTNLTMAMTAKAVPNKQGFGPFANEIYRAPMSYPFRDGLDGGAAAARAIDIIEKQVGRDAVAAIVIEPIQGEGGFIVPAEGFLPALAEWARDAGSLFIADEIQSGFGRAGTMFAIEHDGVVPDIVITAKGIAGGLPLSAITGRAEILDGVRKGGLGGTYSGNPIACAAALGTIETLESQNLVARSGAIGQRIGVRLEDMRERYEIVGDVRGRGAMRGLEFVRPGGTEPNPEACAQVAGHCHKHGVLALAAGTYGSVIRLLPPLVITDELVDEGLDVLEEALAAVNPG
ncbi:4-aminobutyrate--2-oxoglutarate transaminase [Mycobacterium sp. SMC-4]|uniref:4-aminobutyrate--2-oxoglutarate transaminase n=1 Tax=Mycobacterium sp. SMC-4 TaxID=2857059 RepID=UPI003D03C6A6